MKDKIWNEFRLFTEEQIATIQPNETMDGIIFKIEDAADRFSESRLYLSYKEAKKLSELIEIFINENK